MARLRVYLHDVLCPECGSNWMPKDGTSQRPPSISLRRLRTPYHPRCRLSETQRCDKERALAMYQEGSLLSAVARIFGVSVQAANQ